MKINESEKKGCLDLQAFLHTARVARRVAEFRGAESLFIQGDAVETLTYIQESGVKPTAVDEPAMAGEWSKK